jgi:hypothetical protein
MKATPTVTCKSFCEIFPKSRRSRRLDTKSPEFTLSGCARSPAKSPGISLLF